MISMPQNRRFLLDIDETLRAELMQLVGDLEVTLVSGSPRRREILRLAGIDCKVIVPRIDETNHSNVAPRMYALELAEQKLLSVDRQGGIMVAADTIVVLDDVILGKPANFDDAVRILQALSGKRHYVVTALAVRTNRSDEVFSDGAISYVTFHELSSEQIRAYVASGEPMDKAGAYGIQGMGELLVSHLEGSLHNVVGFPIELFVRMLRELLS